MTSVFELGDEVAVRRRETPQFRRQSAFENGLSWSQRWDNLRLNRNQECARQVVLQPWVVHPYSLLGQLYGRALTLIVILVTIVLPLDISFHEFTVLPWVDICICCVFLLDACINFLVLGYREDGGKIEMDFVKIKRHYSWSLEMCCDLCSSVLPLVFYLVESSSAGDVALSVKALRPFWRAFKLTKSRSLLDGEGNHIHNRSSLLSTGWVKLWWVLLYIALAAHVLACGWYLTGMSYNGWPFEVGITHLPWGEQYLTSLYWSITTLTTVGYGDISATNEAEKYVAIAALIVGVMCYAVLIGQMAATLGSITNKDDSFYEEHQSNFDEFRIINAHLLEKKTIDAVHFNYQKYAVKMRQERKYQATKKVLDALDKSLQRTVLDELCKEHERSSLLINIMKMSRGLNIDDRNALHWLLHSELQIIKRVNKVGKVLQTGTSKSRVNGEYKDVIYIVYDGSLDITVRDVRHSEERAGHSNQWKARCDGDHEGATNIVDCLFTKYVCDKEIEIRVGSQICEYAIMKYTDVIELYFTILPNCRAGQERLYTSDPVWDIVKKMKGEDSIPRLVTNLTKKRYDAEYVRRALKQRSINVDEAPEEMPMGQRLIKIEKMLEELKFAMDNSSTQETSKDLPAPISGQGQIRSVSSCGERLHEMLPEQLPWAEETSKDFPAPISGQGKIRSVSSCGELLHGMLPEQLPRLAKDIDTSTITNDDNKDVGLLVEQKEKKDSTETI